MLTRFATLRKGFDDTCSALVHATMTTDLTTDHSWRSRFHAWRERGFSKVFVGVSFMRGGQQAAVGVRVGLGDNVAAAVAGIVIAARMAPYVIAARIPVISDVADRSLVRKLTRLLASYGHAEFTTNADAYGSAHA